MRINLARFYTFCNRSGPIVIKKQAAELNAWPLATGGIHKPHNLRLIVAEVEFVAFGFVGHGVLDGGFEGTGVAGVFS